MPYIKGKGVRDLFFIKIARLGYRKEGTAEEDKNDLRLVFEIEFVKQMFEDYKPIKLDIWRTFSDTTLERLCSSPNPSLSDKMAVDGEIHIRQK